MRAVGAVGPAAAVRREELPEVVRAALEQYLDAGVIPAIVAPASTA